MSHVTAVALTDIEYNGENGRKSARKDAVISDLTEDECLALEALKSVRRLPSSEEPKPVSHAPSDSVPSSIRRKKRGR